MTASSLADFNESVFAKRVFESRESRLRKAFAAFERESARGQTLDVAAGSGLAARGPRGAGWDRHGARSQPGAGRSIRARPGVREALQHDLSGGPPPFEDARFAAVFAGEIIEHLVDTRRFLDELHRVLRPGGLLVVATPNLASFGKPHPTALRGVSGLARVRAEVRDMFVPIRGARCGRTYATRALRWSRSRVTGCRSSRRLWCTTYAGPRWPAREIGFPGLSQGLIAIARRT